MVKGKNVNNKLSVLNIYWLISRQTLKSLNILSRIENITCTALSTVIRY